MPSKLSDILLIRTLLPEIPLYYLLRDTPPLPEFTKNFPKLRNTFNPIATAEDIEIYRSECDIEIEVIELLINAQELDIEL